MESASALDGVAHRPLARPLPPIADIADGFRRYDIGTRASAIAFRTLYALLPFALFVLALAGLLSIGSLWSQHIAPEIAPKVSPPVFEILNSTARKVLTSRQVFWVTAGFLLMLWETSSAVRAVMTAFDSIYESTRQRPTLERYRRSAWLALACGGCIIAAAAALQLGPLVLDGALGAIARFLVAAALLWLTVTLLVRYAPTAPQSIGWVSFGSALVVAGWLVTWTVYGLYLSHIADAGSAFGAFAALIILLAFLQLSATVLLTGALVDSLIRGRMSGDRQGK
jgi:membrane protein